ncbi:MAG: hypothetical protein ACN6PV_03510 [Achromobacter sp.]|uniref:hypothetical protein n=1 Tax=Achromobacter sp. TaxID=134375 RepID=UPI003CFF0652
MSSSVSESASNSGCEKEARNCKLRKAPARIGLPRIHSYHSMLPVCCCPTLLAQALASGRLRAKSNDYTERKADKLYDDYEIPI